MIKLIKILNGITSEKDLEKYNITLYEYRDLTAICSSLIQKQKATFLSSGVYLFLQKYTNLKLTDNGIGWQASI